MSGGWKVFTVKDPTPVGAVLLVMHHDDLVEQPSANVPSMSLSRDEAIRLSDQLRALVEEHAE